MDPVQELLQVADTLLQMADHIQRKRKMDTLVLESNTEFKRLQNFMYKSKRPMRRKRAAAEAEASHVPTTASHVPTTASHVPTSTASHVPTSTASHVPFASHVPVLTAQSLFTAAPVPSAAPLPHVPSAGPLPKLVAVPIDEWEKICLYSSKMVHLIYHQKNLLQTFLPGHSDADIIVQAMSGCTCLKKAC